MKFQTLKKDNRKYWLMGIGVVLIMVAVLCFVGTRAKYKQTQSIQVAKGTINYSSADFSIIAMTDQDGNELSTMPSSGYVIDEEKSYCTVNGVKDTNVILKTIDGNHTFANLQKRSQCYLVFNKISTASNTILANNTISDSRSSGSFTGVYTTDTSASASSSTPKKGTIFSGTDDYGTTYFFAGANPDNWVSFAGFYWRIVRINGDGTVRLIYNGTSTTTTGTGTQISNDNGNTTTYAFNSDSDCDDDNACVGYMYGAVGASTYANTHTNTNSSTIKGVLDTWYSSNLSSYTKYLDGNTGWCGDRTSTTSSSATWPISNNLGGYGTTPTYYGGYARLNNSKIATFKCSQSNDLYTTFSTSNGNGSLAMPVGLITSDEVVYAGGTSSKNSSYWLYTGQCYWTMTPSGYYSTTGYSQFEWSVNSGGNVAHALTWITSACGARPVVNLRADTIFSSGNGTSSSPYVVKTS